MAVFKIPAAEAIQQANQSVERRETAETVPVLVLLDLVKELSADS